MRRLRAITLGLAILVGVGTMPAPAMASSYDSGFTACYIGQKKMLEDGTRWNPPLAGNVDPSFLNGCMAGIAKANLEHGSRPKPPPTQPPGNTPPGNTPPGGNPPNQGSPIEEESADVPPPADAHLARWFWLILRANDPQAEIRRGAWNGFKAGWGLELLDFQPPAPPEGHDDRLADGYELDLVETPHLKGFGGGRDWLSIPAKEVGAALGWKVGPREGWGYVKFTHVNETNQSFAVTINSNHMFGTESGLNCESEPWYYPRPGRYSLPSLTARGNVMFGSYMLLGNIIYYNTKTTINYSCDPLAGRGRAFHSADGKAVALRLDAADVERLRSFFPQGFRSRSFAGLKPAPPIEAPVDAAPQQAPTGGTAPPSDSTGQPPTGGTTTPPTGGGSTPPQGGGRWSDGLWGEQPTPSPGPGNGGATTPPSDGGRWSDWLWSDGW